MTAKQKRANMTTQQKRESMSDLECAKLYNRRLKILQREVANEEICLKSSSDLAWSMVLLMNKPPVEERKKILNKMVEDMIEAEEALVNLLR